MMKKIIASMLMATAILVAPAAVSAHVVVTPKEVGVAAFQTFTMSVPNEKDVPVTSLRLAMPDGIKEVAPTVKPGWDITTKKSGDNVTEIDWTGGTIPAGMRDDFTFSAQAPAKTATLQWKAYQTYQDGTVVLWDQKPAGNADDEGSANGPYSTTTVANDLENPATAPSKSGNTTGAYVLSGVAIFLAIVALASKRK